MDTSSPDGLQRRSAPLLCYLPRDTAGFDRDRIRCFGHADERHAQLEPGAHAVLYAVDRGLACADRSRDRSLGMTSLDKGQNGFGWLHALKGYTQMHHWSMHFCIGG